MPLMLRQVGLIPKVIMRSLLLRDTSRLCVVIVVSAYDAQGDIQID